MEDLKHQAQVDPEAGFDVPVISDTSTNTEVSIEEKLASFRSSMLEGIGRLPITNLSNLNAMLLLQNRVKEHVGNARMEAMNAATDDETRKAIHYNFAIDVLIEDCYASVDSLETMRRELTEGMSLQPLFETAIALSASALSLADTLVTGLEIRDNVNTKPTEPEAQTQTDGTQAS